MSPLDQCTEMLFECIAVGAGEADGFADGDAAMLAGKFDDLQREFRQRGKHDLLPLDFLLQPRDLFGQGAEEKRQPGLPIRRGGTDGSLGLAQGQVVGFCAR